ncbi:hypothetical protein ACFL4D_02285 [Candidatus Margulisiibacteriota bacterium]
MQSNIPHFSKIFKVSFFDFHKVQFQAIGLLIAIVTNFVFNLIAGKTGATTLTGQIINTVGSVLTVIVVLLTASGVSRMIKADLLNESPVSNKEAIEYLKQNAWAIIITPFLLVLSAALIVGLEALLSLTGFIPVLGPILLALFTIPAVIVNVVLAIILIVGSKLIPSIVAIEETNIIDTLKLTYQTCKDEPLKVAFYAGMLSLVGIGIFILPFLVFLTGLLITGAFHWSVLTGCFNNIMYSWGVVPLIFVFITGLSVLIMGSLVVSLALTYFQGVYTYIYLSFKNKF